jgi:hypothetical protein
MELQYVRERETLFKVNHFTKEAKQWPKEQADMKQEIPGRTNTPTSLLTSFNKLCSLQ